MIRTIGDGGINWNWYLCGDFNEIEKTVYVYYYDRWHKYEDRGSKHPRAEWLKTGRLDVIESDGRIAVAISLENVKYTITNPKYVFDYRDFSVYVSE